MSNDDTDALEEEAGFVPRLSEAPFGAVLGSVAAILSAIGTASIGALMLLIVADVIGRNFLNAPVTGVSEIAARVVVAIVFLQVPAAILQKRLTRADFLVRRIGRVSPATLALIEALFCITGAVVFALILWSSWPAFTESVASGEYFGVQGVWTIPTWPFRGITVLGAATAVLAALYRATIELRSIGSAT